MKRHAPLLQNHKKSLTDPSHPDPYKCKKGGRTRLPPFKPIDTNAHFNCSATCFNRLLALSNIFF